MDGFYAVVLFVELIIDQARCRGRLPISCISAAASAVESAARTAGSPAFQNLSHRVQLVGIVFDDHHDQIELPSSIGSILGSSLTLAWPGAASGTSIEKTEPRPGCDASRMG